MGIKGKDGMNVGQKVVRQAANSEAEEPTEDVMDDADVAGLTYFYLEITVVKMSAYRQKQ